MAQISSYQTSRLSEKEKAALMFAELLITAPDSITDALFEELTRHFTMDEIVEMAYFVLYFNMPHRFGAAMHVDAPDGERVVVRRIAELYPEPAAAPRRDGPAMRRGRAGEAPR